MLEHRRHQIMRGRRIVTGVGSDDRNAPQPLTSRFDTQTVTRGGVRGRDITAVQLATGELLGSLGDATDHL